jgi:tRNA-dihydrouridine synthase
MEAVTDIVFRKTVASTARPDLFFTEFVNVTSFCNPKGQHSTRGRLEFDETEQPIVAQVWGNKPEEFKQISLALADIGFAGIDINMGCPDKAVVKQGSGSALIRTPDLACQIIASAKTGGLPVSVKTRIGDIKPSEWHDWIKLLLQQDIANLTVHLRTRKEMSKVPAHYELIPEIVKLRNEVAPDTLITINGDIADYQDGLELANKYHFDGFMVGRGIFTNPFAFEKDPKQHSKEELIDLLKLQLDLHDEHNTDQTPRKFDPLKRYFKIYIRDFPGASELRDRLMHAKDVAEVRRMLSTIQ